MTRRSPTDTVDDDGFRIEDERSLHSWYVFDLIRRRIAAPSGEVFERTYVSTPGAVAVVAITEAGEVVLVRQYRATMGGVIIEVPAGMRDQPGESPELTALRELTEETGYIAGAVERLGSIISSPGVTDSVVEIFLAESLELGDWNPHGPEEAAMQIALVPFDEAVSMVEDGRITDSKTVAGLLLAARMRPHLVGESR